MFKAEARQKYKEIRRNIRDREQKNKRIAENLFGYIGYKKAKTVMIYKSINDEVSTDGYMEQMIADGKTVVCPRCIENFKMDLCAVYSDDDFSKGCFGISEPKKNCKKESNDMIDLCIIPAIAFDRYGNRVGYGKGYYDRFLRVFSGEKIGLAFEECVCERILSDKYDIAVDTIITEAGCEKVGIDI